MMIDHVEKEKIAGYLPFDFAFDSARERCQDHVKDCRRRHTRLYFGYAAPPWPQCQNQIQAVLEILANVTLLT